MAGDGSEPESNGDRGPSELRRVYRFALVVIQLYGKEDFE